MLKVQKCPLKQAGDVLRSWTTRGATYAADSNTEGMEPRLTPLQSWTIELQGLDLSLWVSALLWCHLSMLFLPSSFVEWGHSYQSNWKYVGFFIQWTFEQCSNCRTVGLLEVELNIFCLHCEVVLSLWGSGVECCV